MFNDGKKESTHVHTGPAVTKMVYAMTRKNGRIYYSSIGIAFVHDDASIVVHLNAMPLSGEMIIRDKMEWKGKSS